MFGMAAGRLRSALARTWTGALARVGAAPGMVSGRWARVPHWVWPLAVGAVLLTVGVLVLDDYAVTGDAAFYQRPIAIATVDLALGRAPALFANDPVNRLYGAAFEVLPLFVERIAGLEDTRSIHLTRHLMTHLFFIVSGFCCYLLVYRMTGSRLLGLFAMLLFVLHPRMYGHSFFNSKDIPFLSMFMIALFTVHWAFRKGTVGAFLVCGAAVGILMNLRVMGVMLLPAVLALRACDLYYAAGGVERRRALGSGAAFALAAGAVYYASFPYLWPDPIGHFVEVLTAFAVHQTRPYVLFQGQYIYAGDLPAHFIPVWIGITTPPAALLLAGIGIVAVAGRTIAAAVARAGAAWRNTELRFELLLVGGAALPVGAVIVLESVVYSDWRHMYFVWAPLCLLAAVGLHRIVAALGKLAAPRTATIARVGLAALAVSVLAGSAVPLIRLHPYQQLYFNRLVDRTTPEQLKTQYEMDYYHTAQLEALKYIVDHDPGTEIIVAGHGFRLKAISLPASQRRRFAGAPGADADADADYYVLDRAVKEIDPPGLPAVMHPPALYARKVYHNTIVSVATPELSAVDPATADAYRAIYRAAVGRAPTRRGAFDIYLNAADQTLTLVKEDCQPGDLSRGLPVRVYPADPANLLAIDRPAGQISVWLFGVRLDGKCLWQATMPDYALARIVVEGSSDFLVDDYLAELRRQYAARQATAPAIRADFAVYAGEGELRYLKDDCRPADTAAPFFLHLIPAHADDLPADRREHGFVNRDFNWDGLPFLSDPARGQAIAFDNKCMITVPLPDYTIAAIRTGQHLPGQGRLWGGEFQTPAYPAVRAAQYAARATGAPTAQGFFNIYHNAGALTYIRDDCALADTEAPFYLHLFPAAVNDLPAEQGERGFANRDFDFGDAGGVRHAGRCLVSIRLPDYPLVSIHTGQYAAGDAARRLWAAEIAIAGPERPAP